MLNKFAAFPSRCSVKRKMFNKKSQVGDAITWFVATIVIIVILTVSIYVTSLLGATKIVSADLPLYQGDNSNILLKESLFSFLLTKYNDKKIYDVLISEGEMDLNIPNFGIGVFDKVNNEDKKILVLKKDGQIVFGNAVQDYTHLEKLKLDDKTEIELYFYEVKNEKTPL